ncbi:unnamed protein product [Timema podura]|uniref:C2H2-type domain-containing protein n=1 Tax=Timema podura TaxID=61482 RepID=A0ABN7NF77_TIMPD|nr:unnamed protein product [Timema podura]
MLNNFYRVLTKIRIRIKTLLTDQSDTLAMISYEPQTYGYRDHNLTLEDDSLHKENSVGNFKHSIEAQTQVVPKSKSRGDLVKRKNARHSLATERKVRCGVRSCVYKFTSEKMCAFHMNCHATDENTSKDFQCVSCSERIGNTAYELVINLVISQKCAYICLFSSSQASNLSPKSPLYTPPKPEAPNLLDQRSTCTR